MQSLRGIGQIDGLNARVGAQRSCDGDDAAIDVRLVCEQLLDYRPGQSQTLDHVVVLIEDDYHHGVVVGITNGAERTPFVSVCDASP